MFFDQFDKDTMRVIMDAQTEARALGSPTVGTEHLLLSATTQKRDAMQDLIEALGRPEPLRKPPIKGMQRATIDAVEAIATWHAGEVAAPVVIEEEPEAEAPAPADKGPQTMAEKLAEIKKRAAEAEYAVRNRTPPPTPPPDPPPFLWNGVAIDARGQHEGVVAQGKVVSYMSPKFRRVIQEVHRRPHA